ncbi:MAG: MoxR family ATPase [Kineosporiaceae bacterium]
MTTTSSRPGIDVAGQARLLCEAVESVIQGKPQEVRLVVTCLLAEGHLLLEDVPGTGKTTLARALASAVAVESTRIQFTPDLLPSDVTGVSIYSQATGEFVFRPGPVLSNIVLADEINRASPKTQSALLEVMEEGTVSVEGRQLPVPRPFMVVATQNPVDMEGTYVLPEAQLDRFLMRLSLGYPEPAAEAQMLRAQKHGPTVAHLAPVLTGLDVGAMIETVKQVEVAPAAEDYIVAVCAATRVMPEVRLGVSPRGSLALLRAARALAAVQGRTHLLPDDVKAVAGPVLTHRILLRPEAELAGFTSADAVRRALSDVPVPRTAVGV